jgi:hypothetical protein
MKLCDRTGERARASRLVDISMPKLEILKAVAGDRMQSCFLARQAHSESVFAEIPFSENKFNQSFENILDEPDKYLGLKVMLGDRMLGFCYAMIGGFYVGDARVVTVIAIVTDKAIQSTMLGGKTAMRLVRGIEIWARSQSASFILYHVTSGTSVQGTDRFFRKAGMATLGGNYGVKLEN